VFNVNGFHYSGVGSCNICVCCVAIKTVFSVKAFIFFKSVLEDVCLGFCLLTSLDIIIMSNTFSKNLYSISF